MITITLQILAPLLFALFLRELIIGGPYIPQYYGGDGKRIGLRKRLKKTLKPTNAPEQVSDIAN